MTYNEHLAEIRKRTNVALVKEIDFDTDFTNPRFARDVLDICMEEANLIRAKFKLNLCFGFRFFNEINASADIKNGSIILINHKLINELGILISETITKYLADHFTIAANIPLGEDELFRMYTKLCATYLFYHEFAHIYQLNKAKDPNSLSFREQYEYDSGFQIKDHIYEFDADLLGISFSTAFFLGYPFQKNYLNNPGVQFHLLTLYMGLIGTVLVTFSNKHQKEIYFKKNSHPHQIIRFFSCVEQILFSFSNYVKYSSDLGPKSPFSKMIILRAYSMLDLLHSDSHHNYSQIVQENILEIGKYTDEIEILNDNYPELTRHSSEKIYNSLSQI